MAASPQQVSSQDWLWSEDFSPALDFNMGSFSLSPVDFEPLFFNRCPTSYKDFGAYKEKGPHDLADVLLSLKEAVVHPSQALPSLSPNSFSSYSQNYPSAPPNPYTVHHPQPYNQYQACLEGPPPPPPPQMAPQHASNMFPSMSVNVSMNMTMGMPSMQGMSYNMDQCSAPQHQVSWNTGQPPAHPHPHPHPAANMSYSTPNPMVNPIQMSYCNTPNYSATGSYSFTAEFRPTTHDSPCSNPSTPSSEKEFAFKSGANPPSCQVTPSFKPTKSFGFNHLANLRKRAAAMTSRGLAQVPVSLEVTTTASLKANLCRICGKTYARPSTLKTHMRTHSGEKPYRCNTCSKSFSQAANLTAHIRTHSGEKPFRCPICDRRFSQSSSVTTHVRTHSGERPYRCRLCKKAFSDSSTLTKHLRIHSGEKPYQCKLCLLRFSQSGNLNRHMRIHAATA